MRLCERCNARMAIGRPRVRRGKQLWCQTCAKDIDAPSGRYRPGSDIATQAHVDISNTREWHPSENVRAGIDYDQSMADTAHLQRDHQHKDLDSLLAMSPAQLREAHDRAHSFEDSQRGGAMEKYMPKPHTHDRRHFDPHSDGTMHSLSSLEPQMAIKIALREQKTGQRLFVLAHDSGDGQTIYHCPFCGSGQVLARSDKTIECEFCHTSFTVQVQPEYSAFPQTMDGQPIQVPGMPGQIDAPVGGGPQDPSMPGAPDPGMDPNADTDADGIPDQQDPDADGDGFNDADPASADNQPPWLKSGLRTQAGVRLPLDEYVRHLAIKHTEQTERPAVLRTVRASRSQS